MPSSKDLLLKRYTSYNTFSYKTDTLRDYKYLYYYLKQNMRDRVDREGWNILILPSKISKENYLVRSAIGMSRIFKFIAKIFIALRWRVYKCCCVGRWNCCYIWYIVFSTLQWLNLWTVNLLISVHIISKRLATLIMEECERYISLRMISIWCNIYNGMNYTLTHHQNLIQHLSFFLIFNISCDVYFINRACVRFYMKMTFEYL